MAKITSTWLMENITGVESASKRNGEFTVRKGYFYRAGGSSERFEQSVSAQLDRLGIKHTIIDNGDQWAPFKGGASVANQSHYWVKFNITQPLS